MWALVFAFDAERSAVLPTLPGASPRLPRGSQARVWHRLLLQGLLERRLACGHSLLRGDRLVIRNDHRVLGEELLLGNLWALPFALWWVRGGAQVDDWMHTEIVGPAVFTLIGILAMRYWLGPLEVRAAQAREQVVKVTSKLRNRRA